MSRLTQACCYCKREIHNGMAVGAPLVGIKYANASHGWCTDCMEDFENGFTTETILARAAARTQHLTLAPAQGGSSQLGPSKLHNAQQTQQQQKLKNSF